MKKTLENNHAEPNPNAGTPKRHPGSCGRLREADRFLRYWKEDDRMRSLEDRSKEGGGAMQAHLGGSSRGNFSQSQRETATEDLVFNLKVMTQRTTASGGAS